jgi:hypothetical protein
VFSGDDNFVHPWQKAIISAVNFFIKCVYISWRANHLYSSRAGGGGGAEATSEDRPQRQIMALEQTRIFSVTFTPASSNAFRALFNLDNK